MGEISPQTVNAIRQAMARARAADDAGDKVRRLCRRHSPVRADEVIE
jgi:hypothetical protein